MQLQNEFDPIVILLRSLLARFVRYATILMGAIQTELERQHQLKNFAH